MVAGTLGSLHKAGSTKMANRSTKPAVAGVDVGKDWLDLARADGSTARVANDPAGHAQLIELLDQHRVERVGLEASGGYERRVVSALRQAGHTVTVLQPAQVRAYARFKLRRAKTDRIDAQLIAQCTAELDLRPSPDPRLEPLAEHLTFIEQIEDDLARAKTRLEHLQDQRLRAALSNEIKRLAAWRRDELNRLTAALRCQDDLARRLALLQTIQGLGERTALALLVRLPPPVEPAGRLKLGTLNREQVAALVGVAPFHHQSGHHTGERHIAGGRKRLRKSLFAAAQIACRRWNPALIDLYQRLIQAGKPHTLAVVACTRKLAIYANTVLARNTPWQPHHDSC
jgi:transposase